MGEVVKVTVDIVKCPKCGSYIDPYDLYCKECDTEYGKTSNGRKGTKK